MFMKHARTGHLLRWLLLVWLGLIAIWGFQLMGLLLIGSEGSSSGVISLFPGVPSSEPLRVSGTVCPPLSPSLFTVLLFSGLMIGHAGLYWFGLSGKMPQRWRFPYLTVQGLLVGLISFCLSQGRCGAGRSALPEDFLICLYLALIIGAISLLDQARAILAVVAAYLLLLVLNTVILQSRVSLLVSLQASAQSAIWYLAMILFVAEYIVIYLQQLRTHSQLQVTHVRLKASTARIEELTRSYERQRLARELHDTLAQGLAGLVLQLEAANTHLTHQRAATAQEIIQQAVQSAREALIEARGAIEDLRAPSIGASEAADPLQKEIDRFVAESGIPCNAQIPQKLCLSPALEKHLLGIVREGLTNITRHAQAQQASLSLVPRGELLVLDISDDGIGFDPKAHPGSGHYGLIGIRERARLLGGSLTIRSAPDAGTRLQVSLPGGQEAWGSPGQILGYHEQEREGANLHV
jgi:NarL family two-component system sensor histidine kinase YdfH